MEKKTLKGDAKLELGRKVYNFRCYFCHGYSGDARTEAARQLFPPPRDFTSAAELTEERIAEVLETGIANTAMKSFANVIGEGDRAAVAAFVVREFVQRGAANTRYHTAANGWPDHAERYGAAFPFVRGMLSLDVPSATLDEAARAGRRLYLEACTTCHEPAGGATIFEAFPLSHMGQVARDLDAVSGASVYAKHDRAPIISGLTAQERQGKELYEETCAFCHAADGTGKNWIGAFLDPHPRDFTDPAGAARLRGPYLRQVIREGLPQSSMPAWKAVLTGAQIEAIAGYVERAFLAQATVQ